MTDALQAGSRLAEAGRFAEAIACFEAGLSKEGAVDAELWESVAQCELQREGCDASLRAVAAAQQAMRLAPTARLSCGEAALTLARALLGACQVPEALRAYEQAEVSADELAAAQAELPRYKRRMERLPEGEQGWEARFQRVTLRAKRRRRPSWTNSDWEKRGLAAMNIAELFDSCRSNISRVEASETDYLDFGRKFQQASTPALLLGAMRAWPASQWTLEAFAAEFGHQKMICDNHRFGVTLRMRDFVNYMKKQKDDAPLYLFDHCFGEYPSTRVLVDDFEVPAVFAQDSKWGLINTPGPK